MAKMIIIFSFLMVLIGTYYLTYNGIGQQEVITEQSVRTSSSNFSNGNGSSSGGGSYGSGGYDYGK